MIIDFSAFDNAEVYEKPFRFFAASDVLTRDQCAAIRRDYPPINKSGYLPLSKLTIEGAFAKLITDLQSDKLATILSSKLNIDLSDRPRMITVRRLSKDGDGRIHNDSKAKICTMLIYLNEEWNHANGGAIRALNGPDDLDDVALEVPPLAGRVFGFARSENSWHGHHPFIGERHVVQTTFLTSNAELSRKENRGGVQHILKSLNPFAR